jgi:diguanylate cyclase (GGDEF)-like protein
VSPDTKEWVIANTTLIPAGSGRRAIVHFELTVESFREAVAADGDDYEIRLVDRPTGRVLMSSDPQDIGTPLGDPSDRRFVGTQNVPGPRGQGTIDGARVAYARYDANDANANDWVLIAISTVPEPALIEGFDLVSGTLVGLGLLLLITGLTALTASRRRLEVQLETDPLTGLSNRRRLLADLEQRLGRDAEPGFLLLLDLDGFKTYNDTFGHLAGDALLARLGDALSASAEGLGARAYRLAGDEFCVLAGVSTPEHLSRVARHALSERGEGFSITASCGWVQMPEEASTAHEALRLADGRMYADKRGSRSSTSRQATDALVQALAERLPDLEAHVVEVAELAVAVAQELGMDGEALQQVRQAAELHDVGKVAIPDTIIHKAGPLGEEEWTFMRRHTIIGERILAAAPALAPVAALVRSSHERWDATGYPDRLGGHDIPLGARIVAVCDAFEAIVADRAYRRGRPAAEAMTELRRCAGSQFDPLVVEAFASVWNRREAADPIAAAVG